MAKHLVAADHVEVVRATKGQDDGPDVLRLQWTPERHVLLRRTWAPFTRVEQARASALLRLSAAIAVAAGDADAQGWVEPVKDGTVWIRLAHPEDAEAVGAMHRRCSDRTLYLRYVSSGDWHEIQMRRLSGGHSGATLVAVGDEGTVIGLGNVFPERPGDKRQREIAVLVEDSHQGEGVGTALLRRQLRMAAADGVHRGGRRRADREQRHDADARADRPDLDHADRGGQSTMRAPLPAGGRRDARPPLRRPRRGPSTRHRNGRRGTLSCAAARSAHGAAPASGRRSTAGHPARPGC